MHCDSSFIDKEGNTISQRAFAHGYEEEDWMED
jgi:hypothetical protein